MSCKAIRPTFRTLSVFALLALLAKRELRKWEEVKVYDPRHH
jgi:hypothetical protein